MKLLIASHVLFVISKVYVCFVNSFKLHFLESIATLTVIASFLLWFSENKKTVTLRTYVYLCVKSEASEEETQEKSPFLQSNYVKLTLLFKRLNKR
eukprot:UN26462